MVGKLANFHADLSDKALKSTGAFKMVTSGDSVYVNRKYLNPISTTITAKQIYSANKIPETSDRTPAFFRRWLIINFPNTFEGKYEDKNLKRALEAELPGILNWALAGLKRLQQNQRFTYELLGEEAENAFIMASNPVAAFVELCLEKESTGQISKAEMYGAFITFARKQNMPTMADNAFARKLKEEAAGIAESRPYSETAGKQERVWQGFVFSNYQKQLIRDIHVSEFIVSTENILQEDNKENNLDKVGNPAISRLTPLYDTLFNGQTWTMVDISIALHISMDETERLVAAMIKNGECKTDGKLYGFIRR